MGGDNDDDDSNVDVDNMEGDKVEEDADSDVGRVGVVTGSSDDVVMELFCDKDGGDVSRWDVDDFLLGVRIKGRVAVECVECSGG